MVVLTCQRELFTLRSVKTDGNTKLYGIVGNPVAHSLSPLFQSWFIEKSGVNAAYVPFRVDEKAIESAVLGLWALNVQGFNVTVPYKETVMPYVEADESAAVIGAVNTVMRGETGWKATNTDWIGFSRALEAVDADAGGATVLMFGAGGTAKAVVYALAQMGVSEICICNRSRERAETLAAYTREHYSHIGCELIEWESENVEAVSLKSKIVINTTSIGLKGEGNFPFRLSGEGVAVDAVYRPDGNTAFCMAGRESGRLSIDGLPMLIAQGAASFSKWVGMDIPPLLEALRWTEAQVGRAPVGLPGWERRV